MALTVTSKNFKHEARLPDVYTCAGADVSPHITWSKGPQETESYVLICDDPDAPDKVWVHWVLFNIPTNITELHENIEKEEILQNGARQGTNDFGRTGYGGACPPLGHGTHHYYFKVYALNCTLKIEPGATKEEIETAMDGHILAEGQIIGTYSR